jgi:uncharacterized membrane protein
LPSPYSTKNLLIFIFILAFLITFIQVGVITIVFDKLGLSHQSAFLLLFASLFGSGINLPVFSIKAEKTAEIQIPWHLRGLLKIPEMEFTGRTKIALNVGGCLIPVSFSIYLVANNPLSIIDIILSISLVTTVSYLVSRPIHGLGIGMPIFIAPLTAAFTALLVNPEYSAPLAYICGTTGVLIGADLFRLKDIGKMGTPIASIGGAGTFDGIFITGIVAVLLA